MYNYYCVKLYDALYKLHLSIHNYTDYVCLCTSYLYNNYINSPFLFSIGDTLVVGLIIAYVFASLFCLIYCVLIFMIPICICNSLGVGIGVASHSRPQKKVAYPVSYPRRSSSTIMMKGYEKA